jgi:hypothetical protein
MNPLDNRTTREDVLGSIEMAPPTRLVRSVVNIRTRNSHIEAIMCNVYVPESPLVCKDIVEERILGQHFKHRSIAIDQHRPASRYALLMVTVYVMQC